MAFLGEYFQNPFKDADGNRVKGLSWKSGNTGVCTVDADGVVTATGKGTTTVSTTYGGKSFECIIRCNSIEFPTSVCSDVREFFRFMLRFSRSAEQQGDAPQTGKTDHCVDNAADARGLPA